MRFASPVGTDDDPKLDRVWELVGSAWDQFKKNCGSINETIAKAWKTKDERVGLCCRCHEGYKFRNCACRPFCCQGHSARRCRGRCWYHIRKILSAEINVPILTPLFKRNLDMSQSESVKFFFSFGVD
ncbi:hypothetical protein BYT27DRAFT_6863312 [Phlegmacium glaucopus]|nr:hypothetical protein BYT27DRAFT_6863312 [Phlegmacium glaucopus]